MNTQEERNEEARKAIQDYLAEIEKRDEVELAARWKQIKQKEFNEGLRDPIPSNFGHAGEAGNMFYCSGEPLTVGCEGYIADMYARFEGKFYTRPGYVLDFNPEWYVIQLEALSRKAPLFLPFNDFDKKRYLFIGQNLHACKTFVTLEGVKRFVEFVVYEFPATNTCCIHIHDDPINNGHSGFAAYINGDLQAGLRLICELDFNAMTWRELRELGFDYLFGS